MIAPGDIGSFPENYLEVVPGCRLRRWPADATGCKNFSTHFLTYSSKITELIVFVKDGLPRQGDLVRLMAGWIRLVSFRPIRNDLKIFERYFLFFIKRVSQKRVNLIQPGEEK